MAFQKKCPFLTIPDDFVLLKSESRYRNVEVYHKDRFIQSMTSKELKNSVQIIAIDLGLVIQFVLYYYLKHAIGAIKHQKYESFSHSEVIDNF